MAAFTIDAENNITLNSDTSISTNSVHAFASAKELGKVSAQWSAVRLTEIWNSFAGVAPFGELRVVKRFTSRAVGAARIWSAIQRLLPEAAEPSAVSPAIRTQSEKSESRTSRRVRTRKPEDEPRSNKKVAVIALMRRARGATLAEIMEATSWQKHTVRGFVSNLGNKGGVAIESLKNAFGERAYRISKLGR